VALTERENEGALACKENHRSLCYVRVYYILYVEEKERCFLSLSRMKEEEKKMLEFCEIPYLHTAHLICPTSCLVFKFKSMFNFLYICCLTIKLK